ncbi:MAG: hypothetical protein U0175_33410 [Caldilineaceae bacterium]
MSYCLDWQNAVWNAAAPYPLNLLWAKRQYTQVCACDGSTLDALLCKVGLQENEKNPLAGRMLAILLDIVTRLPTQVWYEEDAQAHDQSFLDKVRSHLLTGSLLIFDLGFTNFTFFRHRTRCLFHHTCQEQSGIPGGIVAAQNCCGA